MVAWGIRSKMSRIAALTLFTMCVPFLLLAQDQAEEVAKDVPALEEISPEQVGQQGAQQLEILVDIIVEARGYNDRLVAASPEDSLVLRIQLAKARDRFIATLKELSGLVADSKGDEEAVALHQRVKEVYVEVTPRVWEIIQNLRNEIDNIRSLRTDTAAADRSALEDEMRLLSTRLDNFIPYGLDHITTLEGLGQDMAADREIFAGILLARVNELSGRMDLASLRVRELGLRLKETPGDADLTALLIAASKSMEMNVTAMGITLDVMDNMQLPTERYRTQLVTATQDLASGLLDAKVTMTLLRRGWDSLKGWLRSEGPTFLVKVVLFLVILIAGRFLSRLVSRAVAKSLDKANVNMSFLLKRMTVTFAKNAVLALAVVFGLAQLGISLGPLLAGFGVIGFILGFAMQDSLSNLAAGMMILINRPYDVGDLVEISGVFGKVEQMSMVSTSVLTLDNQKLVVPNSKIWGDVIKNVTDQRVRRVDMTFGISYTDDIPHAEEVLKAILADHEDVLNDPEPVVRLHTLNDSSVDFVVRPWVKTDEYWNVYWDVTRAVKMRFDAEGISIPFPQRDVHIYEQKKLAAAGIGRDGGQDAEQDPVPLSGQEGPEAGDSD